MEEIELMAELSRWETVQDLEKRVNDLESEMAELKDLLQSKAEVQSIVNSNNLRIFDYWERGTPDEMIGYYKTRSECRNCHSDAVIFIQTGISLSTARQTIAACPKCKCSIW